jgi:hypothetical protein
MTKDAIIRMAKEARFYVQNDEAYSPSNQEDFELTEHLERFAKLVADKVYAKQLELPEPRLTGKFSITMGKFKCTGCTGLWDSSEDAKHHSCRDYQ